MMTLTWDVAIANNMINNLEFCLTNEFPIAIAKEFCERTVGLPLVSYEFNGPGVCLKLEVIAKALMKAVNITRDSRGYEYVRRIFELLTLLRNEVRLAMDQFHMLEATLTEMEAMLRFKGAKVGYITNIDTFDGVIGLNVYEN